MGWANSCFVIVIHRKRLRSAYLVKAPARLAVGSCERLHQIVVHLDVARSDGHVARW